MILAEPHFTQVKYVNKTFPFLWLNDYVYDMALTEGERVAISERIKFNTEIIKLFGLLIIATATGIFTLVLGGIDNAKEFLISFLGLVILAVFVGFAIFVYMQSLRLLRELRDD